MATHHGNGHADAYKSPQDLQHEVEETRHRLEDRIDSLSYSLSPGEMLDQALGMARQHGGEFGGNLGQQVKNNPLPLLLTTVGLSWLMASSKSPGHFQQSGEGASLRESAGNARLKAESARNRAGSAMHRAGDKAGHAMESSRERAGQMKESVSGSAHSAADSVSSGLHSSREQLMSFFHDQPVLAASLGVALGASLGAMFPHSETEDRLMGKYSDQAKERAKEEGGRQYEKAREQSKQAAEEVTRAAREKVEGSSSQSQPSSQAGASSRQQPSSGSSGYSPGAPRP